MNGDVIRQGMAKLQYTFDELAAMSGVARASIFSAIKGSKVRYNTAWALASALNVDFDEIAPEFIEERRKKVSSR